MTVQMSEISRKRPGAEKPLAIVHCVRSTVGGIFRHIGDLIRHQSACGHRVGLICDSLTGGAFEAGKLDRLRPYMACGVMQLPMSRGIAFSDIGVTKKVAGFLRDTDADVLHCHGAKGGAYGRLAASWVSRERRFEGRPAIAAVYSPHGGSLHYGPRSPEGRVYFALERFLERFTSEFLFVAAFEAEAFERKIGVPRRPWTVAYNGLDDEEFVPVKPARDAVDFVYAGHMRDLKGADLFIDALEIANARHGAAIRAEMIGDGEDRPRYEAQVRARGLQDLIVFRDPMPIRAVFARGRNLVVPSRAEAMPYIVLEAIGAEVPALVTGVGGIPEIFGPYSNDLLAPGDANLIAAAMLDRLRAPKAAQERAAALRSHIAEKFTIRRMCEMVDGVYARHLAEKAFLRGQTKELAVAQSAG